jgi:hypothetical protein
MYVEVSTNRRCARAICARNKTCVCDLSILAAPAEPAPLCVWCSTCSHAGRSVHAGLAGGQPGRHRHRHHLRLHARLRVLPGRVLGRKVRLYDPGDCHSLVHQGDPVQEDGPTPTAGGAFHARGAGGVLFLVYAQDEGDVAEDGDSQRPRAVPRRRGVPGPPGAGR